VKGKLMKKGRGEPKSGKTIVEKELPRTNREMEKKQQHLLLKSKRGEEAESPFLQIFVVVGKKKPEFSSP